MSLEPTLPFEFVVNGIAISAQGSPRSKNAWKEIIRGAARSALPEGAWLLSEPLEVTIFLFPAAEMQGDIDNRVKPILDALSNYVYRDDEQVERLVVQRFSPAQPFRFLNPSEVLISALGADGPVVYIRVADDLRKERSV
jgi:hypothetical protein